MPVLDPKVSIVRAYTESHGLDLALKADGQYEGECPGCSANLFRVDPETGLFNCRKCDVSGNLYTFLRWIHELGTTSHLSNGKSIYQKYEDFAESRSLLSAETLRMWQVFLHPVRHEWTVPGYDLRGEIMNLYVYRSPGHGKKPILMSTAGCERQLFGMHQFDRRKGNVFLCESLWDALVMWEVLQHTRETSKGYVFTENRNLSLDTSTNVIAVPGANLFREEWCELFNHKRVVLVYHSDHPKESANGHKVMAGLDGIKRVIKHMVNAECIPDKVEYVRWGELGYDPDLEDGYDVRDFLTEDE